MLTTKNNHAVASSISFFKIITKGIPLPGLANVVELANKCYERYLQVHSNNKNIDKLFDRLKTLLKTIALKSNDESISEAVNECIQSLLTVLYQIQSFIEGFRDMNYSQKYFEADLIKSKCEEFQELIDRQLSDFGVMTGDWNAAENAKKSLLHQEHQLEHQREQLEINVKQAEHMSTILFEVMT
ncbi:hypothetical protein HDU92_008720, partial [Lobulomyces angularis]